MGYFEEIVSSVSEYNNLIQSTYIYLLFYTNCAVADKVILRRKYV